MKDELKYLTAVDGRQYVMMILMMMMPMSRVVSWDLSADGQGMQPFMVQVGETTFIYR